MDIIPYETILCSIQDGIGMIELNRPDVHNALNAQMIVDINKALADLSGQKICALILSGKGKSFCAGADISWMRSDSSMNHEKLYEDSKQLSDMLTNLYHFPLPVLAYAHGYVFGGGIGLLSASDITFCEPNTTFCFSEVSIGLVPAIISPFVIRRTGLNKAKEWMLTAGKFEATEAYANGLINRIIESDKKDLILKDLSAKLQSNSPQAMKITKRLLLEQVYTQDESYVDKRNISYLTQVRRSHDGIEGMTAFLEKRKPNWH